jgi:hypothetical protein
VRRRKVSKSCAQLKMKKLEECDEQQCSREDLKNRQGAVHEKKQPDVERTEKALGLLLVLVDAD